MAEEAVIFGRLETDRCILRPLVTSDTAFLFRHFADERVNRWLVDAPPPKTEADAQAIADFYTDGNATRNRWIIEIKASGEPIGTCGFHVWEREHRRAEIGYDLASASWRQGLGSEAVRAALQFGFGAMALHRVEAFVHVENAASRKLLEGIGFQLEGTARENFFANGRFHDHWCFALLEPGEAQS